MNMENMSGFDPDRTVPNMRVRKERGELQVGDVILRRYELLEKLGSGAMGVVFKCRDQVSQVEYALKMVPPELARDAEAMEDVRENFKLIYNLNHPNIAGVKFLDRDEYGSYFLIMEYAQGESLTQWIKKKWRSGRPDPAEVIHIVNQIAAALDYAHGQQVLHRDIKPANVMVDAQGNVKVLDFGLASKIRSTMTALSINPANTSGTPHYLSPEQFKGKYPGPAADQYALGVLTYQMLAGHLPFEADDFNILSRAVLQEEPDPIGGIPPAIETAVRKALSKDPKQRYQNCSEFAAALKAAFSEPVWVLKTEPKKPVRHTWIWAVLFVAAVVLVSVGVMFGSSLKTDGHTEDVEQSEVPERSGTDEYRRAGTRIASLPSGDFITVELSNNVKLAMVKVEAGSFEMSAKDGENYSDEVPHWVTLTRDFYIGKTEVTQAQWKAVMGNNPSYFKGDNLPVENVSWNEAMEFCAKLNSMGKAPKGWKFTLPTETQWEYAARGGKNSRGFKYSGSNNVGEVAWVAWYDGNSGEKTHPVGTKKANELGLYDMSGNVWEWCLDDYQEDSSRAKPEFDRGNDQGGSKRVSRGGSWYSSARFCRSAIRYNYGPGNRYYYLGFRLALVRVQ